MNLIKDEKYETSLLQLYGWTDGDGTGHDGYNLHDYFDADGRYLGPDEHGIEPIVISADGSDATKIFPPDDVEWEEVED